MVNHTKCLTLNSKTRQGKKVVKYKNQNFIVKCVFLKLQQFTAATGTDKK